MISWRYHLVSIVAVFLALALGVVMGTTVVKQGVIDELRSRTNAALNATHQAQNEIQQLQTEVGVWTRYGTAIQPILLADQLSNDGVVIVTIQGVDLSEVDGIRHAFQQSGATVMGILEATPRMALADARAQQDMAAILGIPTPTDQATLAAEAARTIGARLASGPPETGIPDPLHQFIERGFIALLGGSAPASSIGLPGQLFAFVAGGAQAPAVSPTAFLVPVLDQVVTASRPTAAAETATSVYPFVTSIRSDGSLDGRLVTVDNADSPPGLVAVVLGLRDLLRDPTAGGDYGVKGRTSGLIPNSGL